MALISRKLVSTILKQNLYTTSAIAKGVTLGQLEFFAEGALGDLVGLLLVGLGVVEDHPVALLDGLVGEALELEVGLEEVFVVIGRDDHAALLDRGNSEADCVDGDCQPQQKAQSYRHIIIEHLAAQQSPMH